VQNEDKDRETTSLQVQFQGVQLKRSQLEFDGIKAVLDKAALVVTPLLLARGPKPKTRFHSGPTGSARASPPLDAVQAKYEDALDLEPKDRRLRGFKSFRKLCGCVGMG
jgi:hypothetical protein